MNSGQLTPEGKLFIEREEARYLEELEKEGYKPTGASISFPRDNQPRRAEQQYLNHLRNIYCYGTDLKNERTGEVCRTIINCDMSYDCTTDHAPVITTRKYHPKIAIAELLGYIRGYTNAQQFKDIGTSTWFGNANETPAWLNNSNRKGENDLGLIYGAVARRWPVLERPGYPWDAQLIVGNELNLFRKVYENLRQGRDDRGEIITFWNPGMFHLGCLRPCMYEHQFSLLGDDLYLNSTQRSNDACLGWPTNMVQCWLLLKLMAQITGKRAKFAYHRSVNTHIYQPQFEGVSLQLERANDLFEEPTIRINPDIRTLEDLETWVQVSDFEITIPQQHPSIKYPFAV